MDFNPSESNSMALTDAKSSLHFIICLKRRKLIGSKNLESNGSQRAIKKTKFFHLNAKIRGNKNTIDKVLFNGKILEDSHEIKVAAVEHFSFCFQASYSTIKEEIFECFCPKVSPDQNQILLSRPNENEVKNAVFALGNMSAPDSDGFSGSLFTSC